MTLWLVHRPPDNAWKRLHHRMGAAEAHRIDLDRNPAPSVEADGICAGRPDQVWLEDDGMTTRTAPAIGKPPYRVPLVAETRAAPRNGLVVATTFAGGGGSSYGYELAGYRVAWADEVVPEARDTYRANHPGTVLDGRDVREVTAAEVLAALGMAEGDLDLLDGSPPCQPFSTAGKRQRGWGREMAHDDGTRQVADDLFFEYARLVEGVRPRAFVAENVSGLVKGVAKGYFKLILRRLRGCGYRVAARLLDAQWLGVPQHRVRLFFVGVREDLAGDPPFPDPLPYRYSVRDALPELAGWVHDPRSATAPARMRDAGTAYQHEVIVGQLVGNQSYRELTWGSADEPHPMITAAGARTSGRIEVAVEPEAWLRGKPGEVADRLRPGQSGAEVMGGSYWAMRRLHPDEPAGTVQAGEGDHISTNQVHPTERRRLTIAELRRVCGFPDDYVLTGTYEQRWARLGNSVPPPMAAAVGRALEPVLLGARERTSAATA